MGIRFRCGSCEKKYELDPRNAGKKLRCKQCGAVCIVPHEASADGSVVYAEVVIAPGQAAQPADHAQHETAHQTAHASAAGVTASATEMGGQDLGETHYPAGAGAGRPRRRRPQQPGQPSGRRRPTRQPEPESTGVLLGFSATQLGIAGSALLGLIVVAIVLFSSGSGDSPTDTNPGNPSAANTGSGDNSGDGGGSSLMSGLNGGSPEVEAEPEPLVAVGPESLRIQLAGEEWRAHPNFGKPRVELRKFSDEDADAEQAPEVDPDAADIWLAVGETVEIPLATTGGSGSPSWRLAPGSRLPAGLTLSDGIIRGTPMEVAETWQMEFVATDAEAAEASVVVSMRVVSAVEVLPAENFPTDLMIGRSIRYGFEATGGVQPYRWVTVDGAAADGLTLDEQTGVLRGSPNTRERFSMTVAAFDARYPVSWQDTVPARRQRVELARINVKPAMELSVRGNPPPLPEPPDEVVLEPLASSGDEEEELDGSDEYRAPGREELAQIQALAREALNLMGAGEHEEALPKLQAILEIDERNTNAHYNIACCYSLMRDADNALKHLRLAIENGFVNFAHIERDTDLDYLRRTDPYKEMMADTDALAKAVANRQVERLQQEWPGYLTHLDEENKLVFATNQNQTVLNDLIDRITTFAEVLWRDHEWEHPDYYITIILPSSTDFTRYKQSTGVPMGVGGWYSPSDRLLISGTVGHVLIHEFVHALHFADLGAKNIDHNIWFKEGLATLYEDSELPDDAEGHIHPVHSLRLQSAKWAQRPSWREIMKMNHRTFMADYGYRTLCHYGMSRYMTMFLHEQEVLYRFYAEYSRTFDQGEDGRAGIVAMERVFRRSIEQIEEVWEEWLDDIEDPRRNRRGTYLGVKLYQSATELGLRVAEVTPGSPAEEAGFRVDDYINQVAGQPIDSMHGFQGALARYEPGDIVEVKVIRQFQDVRTGEWLQEPVELRVKLGEKR